MASDRPPSTAASSSVDVVDGETAIGAPPTYDRWFDTRWGRYAFAIEARAIVEALGAVGRGRVLDAGAGTGRFAESLEARGTLVVAADRDPGTLTLASRRIAGPRVIADVHRLPFRTGAFSASVAVTVLCFAADPAAVFAELARVTRPGGRLVVGELNRRSPWGLAHARRFREQPWRAARFLTRRQLVRSAARWGPVQLRRVLFAPGAMPGLSILGPLFEKAGRLVPSLGAFQVVTVERK